MPDGRIAIMRFLRASLVVAAGLLAATGRAAEPGTVSGLVRLEEGGPLRGVLVEAKGGSAHGATDADGRFRLEGVAPGTVEVTFRLPGFVSVVRRVEVRAGEDAVLEVAMPLSASASVVVTTKRSFRNLAEAASPGDLIGVADSATEGAVTGAQIDDRPIWRPGDVLESVPGLVVSQHSGDGKANQYYLRGFNIDHGTDLATSIAGMPVNMPTHGHGQGYTDTSFLIPELVSGVQFRKGPYFADTGDFSNAGAVDILYVNSLERGIATAGVGENGYFRTLAADSPELGAGRLLWAAEYTGNDGPWVVPEDYRKWNGLLRYSVGDAGSGWAITAMGYDGSWDSTDQVPRRAVDAGSIDRFGTVDDTDGGASHRYSLSGEWQRSGEGNRTSASVYGIDYAMNLWSNFTYALDDPENGDQFEQEDRRRVYGAQGRHQWLTRLGAFDLESSAGLQVRHDDIRSVGLYHTRARQRLSATRQDSVGQT
ncbi:MAG TPA: TonB-dependent receptor, partial [Thermoanaerobaculia bacterium]